MITKIEVDGFKSLSDFTLELHSGLNILVGPNGSGKTNIILFFEFLSQLTTNPIAHSVSAIGGAGAIFRKKGERDYNEDIKFKIYGSKSYQDDDTITYEYEATITTSFEKDSIYYSQQHLRFRSGKKFWKSPEEKGYSKPKWDFSVSYINEENLKAEVQLHSLNEKKIEARHIYRSDEGKEKLEDTIIEHVKESSPSIRNIIGCLFPIADMSVFSINSDLQGGETFNIVPSKVKEQEDAATPAGIKKDGSGLATTLYAMKRSKSKSPNNNRFRYYFDTPEKTYDPNTLKKIVSYLKLANKTIVDLDVENDPFDNKLVVKIFIEAEDSGAVLPLSAMSDGTIKWLSLITAILTSRTIFSIEEPENFLHPWMQAEIANIMRNHLREKTEPSLVLMTTHSESLLNHSEPNEVILVDLESGITNARRIEDINLIKEEIANSGFGLGHFYFSNVFENE
ncbi:AAA family ATPase [Reichenbachiella sp. MSK19-1]|uniref:AAA family ATPase n=1 Tax=Reichenbachiella sp. MSK19-1 TaxID=1897631 RepID=UPI000E6D272B|nr:ATP-binding protein [Reichenbachiella sp. MSK19-1]RJE71761.1 hypothetical protein BGP76_06645 [Reichenbachiella sp. MSK19-1]